MISNGKYTPTFHIDFGGRRGVGEKGDRKPEKNGNKSDSNQAVASSTGNTVNTPRPVATSATVDKATNVAGTVAEAIRNFLRQTS